MRRCRSIVSLPTIAPMNSRTKGMPRKRPAKLRIDPTIAPTIRMARMATAICMAGKVYSRARQALRLGLPVAAEIGVARLEALLGVARAFLDRPRCWILREAGLVRRLLVHVAADRARVGGRRLLLPADERIVAGGVGHHRVARRSVVGSVQGVTGLGYDGRCGLRRRLGRGWTARLCRPLAAGLDRGLVARGGLLPVVAALQQPGGRHHRSTGR